MRDLIDALSEVLRVSSVSKLGEDEKLGTEWRPESLRQVVDLVEGFVPQELVVKRGQVGNYPHLVVSSAPEPKRPRVVIPVHLDVVPAKGELFEPKIDGDRLVARGALDMKGPGIASLWAYLELVEEGREPSVTFLFTTDEEVGGQAGVGHLAREGWLGEFAFIPDGGHNFTPTIAEKGVLHLRLRATGKAGHGAMPWKGDNAVDKLIGAYLALRRKLRVPDPVPEDYWGTTLNLGVIKGGSKVNMIPDSAEAEIDIRFTAPNTVNSVKAQVEELAREMGLPGPEFLSWGEPVATPEDNPDVQLLLGILRKRLGQEPRLGREHGATDGRFLAERGVPLVLLAPEGDDIHGEREWVSIRSLRLFSEVIKEFLGEVAC